MPLLSIRGKQTQAMAPAVAGAGPVPAPAAPAADSYIEKLVKLIPAEVVAIYLTGLGLIPAQLPDSQKIILPVWVLVCFLLVILVRTHITKDQNTPPDWRIVSFSAFAFIIWSYSMGGPWQVYNLYLPYLGSLLVLVWTFLAPYLYGDG